MAILDWALCPAVETVPGKLGGAWVLRGSRIPVKLVFENLEDGMSIDEIVAQYDLTAAQIRSVLEFAVCSLDTAA
jgi:uncharacterized protein (DUF433 family)